MFGFYCQPEDMSSFLEPAWKLGAIIAALSLSYLSYKINREVIPSLTTFFNQRMLQTLDQIDATAEAITERCRDLWGTDSRTRQIRNILGF